MPKKTTKLKKCKCGSKTFVVHQTVSSIASVARNSDLHIDDYTQKTLEGIDVIYCIECGLHYSLKNFNEIIEG